MRPGTMVKFPEITQVLLIKLGYHSLSSNLKGIRSLKELIPA